MAGFLKPLVVTPLPDGRFWKTTRDLEYCVGAPDSNTRILVPTGFRTDFASVPRVLWNIIPPFGKYTAAAVVHDYLYQSPIMLRYRLPLPEPLDELEMSRDKCDRVFKEAMEVLGVGRGTRNTMWLGVRLGGWITWRKYRKQESNNGNDGTE